MKVDVSSQIVIRRPRAEVAAYASNPDNAPRWSVNIKSVARQTEPPLRSGSRVAFVADFLGRRLAYTYAIAALAPGEKLVMRTSDGPFPMETSYRWETVEDNDTLMTLRNRGDPSGFAGLVAPFMALAMRRANRKDLLRLKQILQQRLDR